MAVVRVDPAPGLRGSVRVPPDKSLTHRALLFGAVSDRTVVVDRPLASADTEATRGVVEACGASVSGDLGDRIVIEGVGLRGLRPPMALDCMNAGTLIRLFCGLLVGQQAERIVLDGDDSLRGRPMARVVDPLRQMGAELWTATGGTPPLVVNGGGPLTGTSFDLPVASAQIKSCLLLAGLFAEGETWVREPALSRDHTERMLAAAGVEIMRGEKGVGVRGPVSGVNLPDLEVPGDLSSAAPFIVAACLVPSSEVVLEGVNLNPARAGLLDVLERMGADITRHKAREVAGEPCADLQVRSAPLNGTVVEADEVPSLIDELPLVALAASLARGESEIRGAAELRVKESDRIATVAAALGAIGAQVIEREDGFRIVGVPRLVGGDVRAEHDHRIAMLGAIAGLASEQGVAIEGFEAVSVSYPGFAADLAGLGAVGA